VDPAADIAGDPSRDRGVLTNGAGAPSVLVPTLDADRAERVVGSLAAQSLEHQVVLVDNGSADGARIAALAGRHPALDVVRLERNAGYSRAVNLAVRRAAGDVLVFVNDDCELEPSFLAELCAALDPGGSVVAAAGVLRYAHDHGLIDSAGIEIDSTLLAFDYLNGEPVEVLEDAGDPYGASAGAAAMYRGAFEEVGGFDEALFAYGEDVDLALRIREAGGRCALARGALGTHEHSATLGWGSARKDYLMGFGRGYVLRKWSVATPRRLPGILVREAVVCAGQAITDRNLGGIRGRLRGYSRARPSHPYPNHVAAEGGGDHAARTLWRRARRRARMRRASRAKALGS
jgi:N-acetylglucosaminyl-diphospho-decaprenol L-rhamnosyltransferase